MTTRTSLKARSSGVKANCWITQVKSSKAGRTLVEQRSYDYNDLVQSPLDPFRSRQTDPQLAKDDCLFHHPAMLGNLYQAQPGERIDESKLAECRALLLDLDHPTRECFRFLDPFEAMVYPTSRSTLRHPRRRFILPLAEPWSAEQTALAYRSLNQLTGGDAGVSQLAFPPIAFLGGPDPTVHHRPGRLISWADLQPILTNEPIPKPSDVGRPKLIKSRSVRRLYQLYRQGDNYIRAVELLLAGRLAGGNRVHCPLPGHAHDDRNPSATLLFGDGHLPVMCCHMGHGHGKLFMSLGELELHKPQAGWQALQRASLSERALHGPTQLLGHARALCRSGAADVAAWTMYPNRAALRDAITDRCQRTQRGWCKDGITIGSGTLERTLDFLQEFTACKRIVGHITDTALTSRFIEGWTSLDHKVAWSVKQFLIKTGAIVAGASIAHGRGYRFGVGVDTDKTHKQRIAGLSPIRQWHLVHPSEIGSFRCYLDD